MKQLPLDDLRDWWAVGFRVTKGVAPPACLTSVERVERVVSRRSMGTVFLSRPQSGIFISVIALTENAQHVL